MTRDPKTDPQFGDVFVYRDGVIEFDALYLAPQGTDGEFMGIELDPSALAAHMPNLFTDIHELEWHLVETIDGHASGGPFAGIDFGAPVGDATTMFYMHHIDGNPRNNSPENLRVKVLRDEP